MERLHGLHAKLDGLPQVLFLPGQELLKLGVLPRHFGHLGFQFLVQFRQPLVHGLRLGLQSGIA